MAIEETAGIQTPFDQRVSPLVDFIDEVQLSDSDDLPFLIRSIRVYTTAGNIRVITASGNTKTFHNVGVGELTPPVLIKRVLTTGTTAVGLEGF